jgi:AraC family transcriptional regulator, transcriptional activator of pobA
LCAHRPASFYARELGISPTHLNRFVRTVTGQGAHELISRKLTDEARRELMFSFGNMKDISDRLGFADPAYFSRFFSRQTGTTPQAFRVAERLKLRGRTDSDGDGW